MTSSPSFVCVSCGELVRGKIEFWSAALLLNSHKGAPKCQSQFTWEKVVNSFAVTDDLIVVCERTDCGYMTCVSRGWHSDPKDGSATPPPRPRPMEDAFWGVEQHGQNIKCHLFVLFFASMFFCPAYSSCSINVSCTRLKGKKELFFFIGKPRGKLPLSVTFMVSFLGCLRVDCHGSGLWPTGRGSWPLNPDPQHKCTPLRASTTCEAEGHWSQRSQCFLIWNGNQFSQPLLSAYCMPSRETTAK